MTIGLLRGFQEAANQASNDDANETETLGEVIMPIPENECMKLHEYCTNEGTRVSYECPEDASLVHGKLQLAKGRGGAALDVHTVYRSRRHRDLRILRLPCS